MADPGERHDLICGILETIANRMGLNDTKIHFFLLFFCFSSFIEIYM